MLKYMRAEIYKVLHRKYTYIFLLAILGCELLLTVGWAYTNSRGNTVTFDYSIQILVLMLSVGLYCTILTEDMVFSDQYKFNTLKNEVAYGLSRARIYLGKLIISCATAVVLCAILILAYLGMCWVALPQGTGDSTSFALQAVGYSLLAALPIWLGGQALVNLVYFLIKSNTVAAFVVVGIIMALPEVFKLLGIIVSDVFLSLYNIMLTTPLNLAPNMVGDWGFIGQCFAIGAGWFGACTLLGLFLFHKREIT